MNEFVRTLLVVFLLLGLAASASAQIEFAVPQVQVEVRIVVIDSSNPSAGGLRWGPSLAALPGDRLTTQLFLNPGMHGLSDFAVSCQFDGDLNDELDIFSIQPLNGASPAVFTQESDGSQEGIIETIAGTFDPPVPAFGPDTPVAEIVFDVNVPIDDGADIDCGLFAAPTDRLLDATGAALDPNDLDFPGTTLNEQRQDYAPSFTAPFGNYPIEVDIGSAANAFQIKTGRICKDDCPDKERGLVFQSREQGFAFAQSPVQIRGLVITQTASVHLDVSGLQTPGSFAAVELDTPFVPIGGSFDNFVIFELVREPNNDLSLFSYEKINGGSRVPFESPVPIPGDSETVVFDFMWANDALDVHAGPMNGSMTAITTDHPFPFNGTAGYGIGTVANDKKEKLGATFEISGDLAMGGRTMALDDLKALIELELAASKDLDGAGLNVKKMEAAKKKLQRAIEKLKLGDKKVPVTDPPEYENPLIQKAYMELQSAAGDKVGKDAMKRLEKAAKRDEMAIKRIDKAIKRIKDGKNTSKVSKDLDTARKFIDKGRDEKVKTKALLETLVKKETKGV